jgi:hypothetical protein
MTKFLFIIITAIVVGLFFYNDPQKLPWVEDSFNQMAGYSIYSQAECGDLDCAVVKKFESLAECREQLGATYDIRKTNPTVSLQSDRAYCYTNCFRKTNGELKELDIGTCNDTEEVTLGGF